ncbi:MAG: dihydroorotase [Armatimonadota bacterium]
MTPDGTLVIRGARVVCPETGRDEPADIYVQRGLIAAVGEEAPFTAEAVIDASGFVVCPGLIDLHVHLREPGAEHKETIATGTRAAVRGGFTTVCAMPNTEPAPDRPATVAAIRARVRASAWCRVGLIGAATLENDRVRLTDFAALQAAGCVAVSDDAFMLRTREQRREALLRCAEIGMVFIAHAEDEALSAGGVMHAGEVAAALGVPGQHAEAEVRSLAAWREAWDGPGRPPLHIAHLSTAAGVRLLREWVDGPTAETAPHYLALTHEAVAEHGANAKMNPPLRTEEDRQALLQAVRDGTVGVIASDHAPHAPQEKARGLLQAPFGVVGLETALSVVLAELVEPGLMSLSAALERLTAGPARVLSLGGGRIAAGEPADLLIFDPQAQRTVDCEQFESTARNTPFAGRVLPGVVEAVLIAGQAVYGDGHFALTRPPSDPLRQAQP